MDDYAVEIKHVSKIYRLGDFGSGTLSEDLNDWVHRRFRKNDEFRVSGRTENKALDDINLNIRRGEILGIIGKNGAGKSTLLKILSRITKPSTGTIDYYGRIASLLEVGTGFHPEMTGRENVYLNGTLLGLQTREIKKRFEEIIDFAGVEKYIDTPVKRYSSGMVVRLGFAVAAHLEPDILVIDEVLAVGDSNFQKKALGKLKDVSEGGERTVLFVSHDMASVSTLTTRAILLEQGKITASGNTAEVIGKYLQSGVDQRSNYIAISAKRTAYIKSIEIETSEIEGVQAHGAPLRVNFEIDIEEGGLTGTSLSFQIIDDRAIAISHFWIFDHENPICRTKGMHRFSCHIPRCRLYMGEYSLNVYLTGPPGGPRYDTLEGVCPFSVEMLGYNREFVFRKYTATYIDDCTWLLNSNQKAGHNG